VAEKIKSDGNGFTSSWVNDLGDPASWGNGIKWLSKAIVSDSDADWKNELRRQLDDHIRAALASPLAAIREVGFFYCLAWKKMDFLAAYSGGDAEGLLLDALTKLYDSHAFTGLSMKLFIRPDWGESVACVSALLSKRLAPPVTAALENSLADPDEAPKTLVAIEELVRLLRVPIDQVRALLVGYWERVAALIQDAFAREDYALVHTHLAALSPLGGLFGDFSYEYCRFLERSIASAELSLLPDALSWAVVWECRACLDKGLERLLGADRGVFAEFLVRHYARFGLGLPDARRLVDFAFKAGGLAPGEGARELLFLCMDGGAASPLLGQAIAAGLEEEGLLDETLSLYALLVEKLEIRSGDILAPRARYLAGLWDAAEGSADPARWREALGIFEHIAAVTGDAFLESEFFLPLLRACLFSPSRDLMRTAIAFIADRKRLVSYVNGWLSEPELQRELTAGIKSKDALSQIRALNRLLEFFWHFPAPSAYIYRCVEDFEGELIASSAEEKLKQRMLRTSGRILRSVSANGGRHGSG